MTDSDSFKLLQHILGSVTTVGEAVVAGPLALAPVYGGVAAPAYLLGSDALAQGLLKIGEMGGGNVPSLVVENTSDLPVLLIDGEHLKGAMQNRVLNTSVLLARHSTTVIPVSCVEAHRWSYQTTGPMQAEEDAVYPRLRRMKAESVIDNVRAGRGYTADQSEVWHDIEEKRGEMNAGPSQTGAMRDIYEARRGDLQRIQAAFGGPDERQTGVIAFVAGHPVVADIFDRPESLRALWPRLIGGYALDAIGHRKRTPDLFSAAGFLAELTSGSCEASVHEGVGLGEDLAMTSEHVVSHALTWEGSVIHLAIFSKGRRSDARRRRGSQRPGQVASPRHRRERFTS